MIKVYIDNGAGPEDYTQFVMAGTLSIEDSFNQPGTCSFSLANWSDKFIFPVQDAYVKIVSMNHDEKPIFTGWITNEPTKNFIGISGKKLSTQGQTFQIDVPCTSDEYLLNVKSIPFIPAYTNIGVGILLGKLADALAPGFFDVTSYCASGDILPYFLYDPTKAWANYAKEFADQYRYRYKMIDRKLYFQPVGDNDLGIAYDEVLGGSRSFKPDTLKTSVMTVPAINDAIVIGDIEAGNNHDDYFVGDGFTSNFPLRHKAFRATTELMLSDDWSETSFDTSKWNVQDPTDAFALVGLLNIVGGPGILGESYIATVNGVELNGSIDFQCGEIEFIDNSVGILGGLYKNAYQLDNSTCIAGFDVRPSIAGVTVTPSGAAGLQIQPTRLGVLKDVPTVTQQNHHYFLRILVNVKSYVRYVQTYRTVKRASIAGSLSSIIYGNAELASTADITWIIDDIDFGQIAANPYITVTPQQYRFTSQDQDVDPFAWFAPFNNQDLKITVNSTVINKPPQGALSVKSLFGPSGGLLPTLPSNLGPEKSYVLGFGTEGQVATLQDTQDTAQLQFYNITIPGVGARIRLQSWEAQAAIGRVRDKISIAETAAIAGDDGVRLQVLKNFKPLPRTSEECDAAAASIITDRGTTQYQGTYTIEDSFFDFDDYDYPIPGRFLYVNAPKRGLDKQHLLISVVKTQITELFEEHMTFTLTFGSDMFLTKTLAKFIKQTDQIFTTKDAGKQPTPQELSEFQTAFLDDLDEARLSDWNGSQVTFDVGMTPVTGIEVRKTDFGWGQNNQNLIGRFATQAFSLPRSSFEQVWYLRQVNGTKTSRRTKVIRVAAPIVPTQAPSLSSFDSSQITAGFSGDVRNIYGVELRASDNATVLVRQPVASPADLIFDLTTIANALTLGRDFYVYFFNLMWEYSPSLHVTVSQPAAPVITIGAKMATNLTLLLDQITRQDILQTEVDLIQTTFARAYVGAGADKGGGNDATPGWSNVGNITAEDGVFATCTLTTVLTSNILAATMSANHFNVPVSATITGIVVEVKGKLTDGGVIGLSPKLSAQLTFDGNTGVGFDGHFGANLIATNGYVMFGGPTNLWSLSITPAQVNALTFGAMIQEAPHGAIGPVAISLDDVRITVYYTYISQTCLFPNQPAIVSITLPNPIDSYAVKARRQDYIGFGAFGSATNIPQGNIISSTFLNGQGSGIPSIDDQISALFSYVATAAVGGGANSAEIIWDWVSFNVVWPDGTIQPVYSDSYDTGQTLDHRLARQLHIISTLE
jgi:hypothetical protein